MNRSPPHLFDLLRAVEADPLDLRLRHKLADELVRSGAEDDALAHYLVVARGYAEQGHALKAYAVFRICITLGAAVDEEAIDQGRRLGLTPAELDLDSPMWLPPRRPED